jgi:predicted transcriptional regulator
MVYIIFMTLDEVFENAEKAKMSVAELSRLSGVHYNLIHSYMKKKSYPNHRTFLKLCSVFK